MAIIIGIILALAIPIIGDTIYVFILYRRRFIVNKPSDIVTFSLSKKAEAKYTEELQRITRKVNGWLYTMIFYTSIYIAVGTWAITFPLLCFFSTSQVVLISICSIAATVASSIMMFLTPKEQSQISGCAWKESSSYMSDFNIHLPSFKDEDELRTALSRLQNDVSEVSKKTRI